MIEHEDEGSHDPKRSCHGQDVSLLYLPPGGQVMFRKKLIPKLGPGPYGLVWKSQWSGLGHGATSPGCKFQLHNHELGPFAIPSRGASVS